MIINGELYHHGIKGQKWGKRRYQNKDGSWTPAGRQRYSEAGDGGQVKRSMKGNVHRALAKNYDLNAKVYKKSNKALSSMNAQARNQQYKLAEKADQEAAAKRAAKQEARNTPEAKAKREKAVKAAKVGAAVAGTALAAYGAYKLNDYVKTKNGQIAAERGFEAATKEFSTRTKDMFDSFGKEGSTYSRFTIDAGGRAKSAADNAANDNFRTAAKNVINYKKSGGDLKNLNSMSFYDTVSPFESEFGKKTNSAGKTAKRFAEMTAEERRRAMGAGKAYEMMKNGGKAKVLTGPDGRPLTGEAAAVAYANELAKSITPDQLKSKYVPSREQQSKIFKNASQLNSGVRTQKSFSEMTAEERRRLMGTDNYEKLYQDIKDGKIKVKTANNGMPTSDYNDVLKFLNKLAEDL
jgi:hypothetical protein